MHVYRLTGVDRKTGRYCTRLIEADSEAQAVRAAGRDGLAVRRARIERQVTDSTESARRVFLIDCVHRDTGDEQTLRFDAESEEEAIQKAQGRGFITGRVAEKAPMPPEVSPGAESVGHRKRAVARVVAMAVILGVIGATFIVRDKLAAARDREAALQKQLAEQQLTARRAENRSQAAEMERLRLASLVADGSAHGESTPTDRRDGFVDGLSDRVGSFLRLGEYAEALDQVRQLQPIGQSVSLALQVGQQACAHGVPNVAAEAAGYVLSIDERNLGACNLLVDARLRLEDWTGALDALDQLITYYPESGPTYQVRAALLVFMGQPRAALDDLSRARMFGADAQRGAGIRSDACLMLAQRELDKGATATAEQYLIEALTSEPKFDTADTLVDLMDGAGRWREAVTVLEWLSETDPGTKARCDGRIAGIEQRYASTTQAEPHTTASEGCSLDVESIRLFIGNKGTVIFADDGTFLGRLTGEFDPDSLANEFGLHGSEFAADSMWNDFGVYGSRWSLQSPFNPLTPTPPRLFANDRFIAYVTVNKAKCPRINPYVLRASITE